MAPLYICDACGLTGQRLEFLMDNPVYDSWGAMLDWGCPNCEARSYNIWSLGPWLHTGSIS